MLGFSCLFGAVVLMRMRAELAETKVEARLRRSGCANEPVGVRHRRLWRSQPSRTVGLLAWALRPMRRAEAAADALKRRQ